MKRLFIISFSMLLLLQIGFLASAQDISPAIDILREETTFIKCALNGADASFTKSDFENVTGCEFDYITISSLPDKEDGILTLSGVAVLEGQCITAESLNLLKFEPAKKNYKEVPSFTFSVSEASWKSTDISCNINYFSSINYAPIANNISIKTSENMAVYTEIDAYDPDNDKIEIKIKAYPSFGSVTVNNEYERITYYPEKNFTGSDMFTFYVEDIYGNKSADRTVDVKVDNNINGISFGDMIKDDMHYAAVFLSENNIMTYTKKGDEYYFSPDEMVNKIDFTVMLLCASKLNEGITTVKDTEFTDDSNLSDGRKSYLKRALDIDIIELKDGLFNPEKPVTFEEAKDMVSKSLGLASDSEEIKKIMGNSSSSNELTKKDVAEILYNVWVYLRDVK